MSCISLRTCTWIVPLNVRLNSQYRFSPCSRQVNTVALNYVAPSDTIKELINAIYPGIDQGNLSDQFFLECTQSGHP